MNKPPCARVDEQTEWRNGESTHHGRVESMQLGVEWVCGHGTDSPTTPLPKTITASTTRNHNSSATQQNIKEVGRGWMRQKGDKSTRWQHMGFSPIDQGSTSPTPYPLESCPFHSTFHCHSWLWFILFGVHIYMMPNYNVPNGMINHRQLSPFPKHTHNQIDGGAFALSSSP